MAERTAAPTRGGAATTVAAAWRGTRCRRWLGRARALPGDLWEHVLHFLRGDDPHARMERAIGRIVSLRVVRAEFAPPIVLRRDFPRVARLVRIYAPLLDARIVQRAARTATRIALGAHARRARDPALLAANALLEWMQVHGAPPDAFGPTLGRACGPAL